MIDIGRREILKAGTGFAAAVSLPSFAVAMPVARIGFVFDRALPAARAAGRAAEARGFLPLPFTDDVTDLWFHRLEPRWRQAPAALAGCTTRDTLFCLETLARQHGLRLAPDDETPAGVAGGVGRAGPRSCCWSLVPEGYRIAGSIIEAWHNEARSLRAPA